jgi:hypothetical protein
VNIISMPAVAQLTEALDALRAAGGTRVYALAGQLLPAELRMIEEAGYRVAREDRTYVELRAVLTAPAQASR